MLSLFSKFRRKGPTVGEPLDHIERLLFEAAPLLFENRLSFDCDSGWSHFGYYLGPDGPNGEAEIVKQREYSIFGKGGSEKTPVHIVYRGIVSDQIFERLLARLCQRDFAFVNGDRKDANSVYEQQTLAKEGSEVAVISIFRSLVGQPMSFSVSAMPAIVTEEE